MLQYRVPIDDTHTIQFGYRTTARRPGAAARPIAVKHSNLFNRDGKIIADNVPAQDMTAWVGQGPVSDRTREHLATSDRGVALYHRLLMAEMDKIERGEEPMALVRDPAENEPMIELGREQRGVARAFRSDYDNYFEKIATAAQIRGR
jgi:5,5'-dehydrodivanillate O-demethylase oxygenase subunit